MKRFPVPKILLGVLVLMMFRGTASQLLQTASALDSVMASQLATLNRQ